MRKEILTDEEIYDMICEYCYMANRTPPDKDNKKEIDNILARMEMLGFFK